MKTPFTYDKQNEMLIINFDDIRKYIDQSAINSLLSRTLLLEAEQNPIGAKKNLIEVEQDLIYREFQEFINNLQKTGHKVKGLTIQ